MTSQITLTEDQARALQIIARSEKHSVDVLVQQAVAAYLEARREEKQKSFEEGFGLLGPEEDGLADFLADKERSSKAIEDAAFGAWGPGEDGLAYQRRLRRDW